ncbi:MAG: hypothetical protein ACRYGA_09990 [Janthinobacterium lividum]
MLAAIVHSQGAAELTAGPVRSLIPEDWRALMSQWLYSGLCPRRAEERDVHVEHPSHDGGGFHFTYRTAA